MYVRHELEKTVDDCVWIIGGFRGLSGRMVSDGFVADLTAEIRDKETGGGSSDEKRGRTGQQIHCHEDTKMEGDPADLDCSCTCGLVAFILSDNYRRDIHIIFL